MSNDPDNKSLLLMAESLSQTAELLDTYDSDVASLPTPCPMWNVNQLANHIVGWLEVFEAGANERTYKGEAAAYQVGKDPAAEFRSVSASLMTGWETHGVDRQVKTTTGEMPGEMVLAMTVMEYVAHGWDLARALSVEPGYSDAVVTFALETGRQILPPEYRGEGMPFAPEVEVDGGPLIDRFAAFMGRDPSWSSVGTT